MEKRALFLTVDFPPMAGGMSRYAYDTALTLKSIAAEPVIIAPAIKTRASFHNISNLHIVRPIGMLPSKIFNCYILSTSIFFIYGIRYCLTGKIGVILANSWTLVGLAAFMLGKIFRVPYIVFAHGLDVGKPKANKKVDVLIRLVLENASMVLTNSNYTKSLVEKKVPRARIAVLHPPLGPAVCQGTTDLNNPTRHAGHVVITVARLVERKGQDTVLRALPAVIKRFPDLVYRIVGEGPYEANLRALARELGIENHVIFDGNVSDEKLRALYAESDIFIMTSREIQASGDVEGFGIVYLEAGAFGKPVIGSRSGGIPDAVIDGVTGILVEPEDEDGVTAAIIKLFSDGVFAGRLGYEGRRRAFEDSNMDVFAVKLRKALEWN